MQEGFGVAEDNIRLDALGGARSGAGDLPAQHLAVGGQSEVQHDAPAALGESVLRDGIDHAAGRGRHPRRRGFVNLDALDVVDRSLAEFEGAAGGIAGTGAGPRGRA